jgi:hypothetical protein
VVALSKSPEIGCNEETQIQKDPSRLKRLRRILSSPYELFSEESFTLFAL